MGLFDLFEDVYHGSGEIWGDSAEIATNGVLEVPFLGKWLERNGASGEDSREMVNDVIGADQGDEGADIGSIAGGAGGGGMGAMLALMAGFGATAGPVGLLAGMVAGSGIGDLLTPDEPALQEAHDPMAGQADAARAIFEKVRADALRDQLKNNPETEVDISGLEGMDFGYCDGMY